MNSSIKNILSLMAETYSAKNSSSILLEFLLCCVCLFVELFKIGATNKYYKSLSYTEESNVY